MRRSAAPTARSACQAIGPISASTGAWSRGRRIEAAQKLGIGRNTITRKIKELGLED